jgi:hypothetical protein
MTLNEIRWRKPCYVYYIGDGNGRIKIGSSCDPISRLQQLKSQNPTEKLSILLTERGGLAKERERQGRFMEEHISGEWFKKSERLENFIDLHNAIYRLSEKIMHPVG